MQLNIRLKPPVVSTCFVLGLAIGALLNRDFGNAVFCFFIIALDVVRIERATKATTGEQPKEPSSG